MKKVYKCSEVYAALCFTVNGASVNVDFKGGSYGGGQSICSKYITEDKDIQNAIEAGQRFKKGQIWVDSIEPNTQLEEDETPGVFKSMENILDKLKKEDECAGSVSEDVTNTQKAIALLATLGVTFPPMPKTIDVVVKAKELGLVLPNWKTYNEA